MNKKKSIALLVVISIVLVVLAVLTFAQFRIPGYKNGTKIYQSFLGAVALDEDLEGGVAYELTLKDDITEEGEEVDPQEIVITLEKRLEALGYTGSIVTAYRAKDTDNYSFRVEMRNSDAAATDIGTVAAYGEIEFTDGNGNILFGDEELKSAKYVSQTVSATTSHYVQLKFTDNGLKILEDAIDAAASSEDSSSTEFTLKITLGDTELFSSTLSKDYLADNSLLITSSDETTARRLALQISSGGLKYEYEISDALTVTPGLGENAASLTFWACFAAVIVIVIALCIMYGGFGAISSVSVFFFIMTEIIMLILVPGVTLNFAGVIGIMAAVLLTVDSMAIIMHRVREEYRNDKTVKAAIKTAYKRSILSILEIDCVLAVFSLLMFLICKGYAANFAVTFGIGVVLSALITMFFSQLLVYMALPLFKEKSEKFLKLKREAK